jgi:hypothetical protein
MCVEQNEMSVNADSKHQLRHQTLETFRPESKNSVSVHDDFQRIFEVAMVEI